MDKIREKRIAKLATQILEIANREYLFLKMEKTNLNPEDCMYMAPELLPQIKSDQVHALIKAISVVLINLLDAQSCVEQKEKS